MRIGIISDVHTNPQRVVLGIQKLKGLGVERLILNGDIGEAAELLEDSQRFTGEIIETAGKSGLETYVQPGSHETLAGYEPVVDILSVRYSNIIDMLRTSFVDLAGYRLLFLPGSDVHSGGEYHLGVEVPSGRYAVTQEGLVSLTGWDTVAELRAKDQFKGEIQYRNIADLTRHIEEGPKTVLVCHVPALFDIGSQGVDFAYFATNREGAFIPGAVLEAQIREGFVQHHKRTASSEEIESVAQTHGFTFHRRNVGNPLLRQFLDQMNIAYAVNGHIHESGDHAHDRQGNFVSQRTVVPELFWNSGCFDRGQMGILTLTDEGVAYENVSFSLR